ncbi:MAG TPA: beta-ketoacyl-[acyl-carrier-protein] synthase II, partial [Deltaproteobacteria bacterium]|nr:beta-ketoacyl-[acyl-carrier-protein] synthase II [Deltaproteobacteria bacterium]
MSDRRRIVVTGLGCVSPLGNSVAKAWSACYSGKSGIGPITHFDASEFRTQIAGEVRNYQVPDIVSPKEARKMELFIRYAVGAAVEALHDANLEIT